MAVPELADSTEATDTDRLLQAEAQVRGYCGWHIAPSRTETLTLDGSGSEVMLLPTLHLTAVTAVSDDATVLDPTVLEWSEAGILRRGDCAWWTGKFRGVVVDVVHGYTDPPADITGVVQALAGRAANLPVGLASKTTGPFSETYTTTFLEPERMILDRYRLPPRP